ncbi:hypothetical protein V4D06_13000 [Vibrio mimicus]|uniref:hypothetical protein n=1 Tax=Vibrio mimicus TaxID=674 RepID=UPI002F948E3B
MYGSPFKLDVCAEPATAKVNRFYTSVEWFELRAGSFEQRGIGFCGEDFNPQARSLALMLWVGLGKMIFGQNFVSEFSKLARNG